MVVEQRLPTRGRVDPEVTAGHVDRVGEERPEVPEPGVHEGLVHAVQQDNRGAVHRLRSGERSRQVRVDDDHIGLRLLKGREEVFADVGTGERWDRE